MSTNKDLFKEAIADAKAVREAALANAKAALEEALTPKLQSMLAAKLNEMDYKMEEEGLDEYAEMQPDRDMDGDGDIDAKDVAKMGEGFTSSHEENSDANLDFNLEEEFDLSEILAELEDDETIKEAKEEDEEEETEEKEEVEVADMSVEDLKALIKDIVSQEIEAEEEMPADEAGEEEADMEMGSEEGSEDEIDLEELLAELDSLNENEEKQQLNEVDYQALINIVLALGIPLAGAIAFAKGLTSSAIKRATKEKGEPLTDEEKKKVVGKLGSEVGTIGRSFGSGQMEEAKKAKKAKEEKTEKDKMKEAIATINILRSELNETNLLNAKLLYVNKIFKAKNLTESQKLKVIASFDKATNVKEAKVVFESLNSALTAAPKKALKESFGFASKAAGVAHKSTIVETNDAITRMQKLANIIK
jgi:hypothetical protein